MASKATYVFATLSDFHGLRELEAQRQVFYVPDGVSDSRDRVIYRSYSEIPGLGQAVTGEWITERRYRVLTSVEDLEIHPFELDDGGTRFDLSRKTIDRSLVWRPGGILEAKRVVIQGSIETISEDPDIINFYKAFVKGATRGFYRQSSERIGPEAVRLCLSDYSLKDFASAPRGIQLTEKTIEKYHRDHG